MKLALISASLSSFIEDISTCNRNPNEKEKLV